MAPDEETGEPGTKCINCGKSLTADDDMFCSAECEKEWLKRETAKAEEEGILFCPRCGSTDISLVIPGLIDMWNCKECGYRGALAVKDGAIRGKIRSKYDESRSRPDSSP
jgi:predicted nucleic acid-binding Zn ribbon protein